MSDFELDTGVGGLKARELTVKEGRALLKDLEARLDTGKIDLQDGLFEDISLPEIQAITGTTESVIEDMRPSEVRKLADACIKANEAFFAHRRRRMQELERIKKMVMDNPAMIQQLKEWTPSGDSGAKSAKSNEPPQH